MRRLCHLDIYASGDEAIRDMNYNLLMDCWNLGLNQYQTADFFRERDLGESGSDLARSVGDWFKVKKGNGFYKEPIDSKNKKGNICIAIIVSFFVGMLGGWFLGTMQKIGEL